MTINGIAVGSGTVPGSFQLRSGNLANTVSGLTGTVTVVLTLSGGTNGATNVFRLDNFTLNGFITKPVTNNSQFAGTANKRYRYGFNGKENDNEPKGVEGGQQDYGMRIYDPRVGRFLSVDPLAPKYPELTPYQFASNTPISAVDLDGMEAWVVYKDSYSNGKTKINIVWDEKVKPAGEGLYYLAERWYDKASFMTSTSTSTFMVSSSPQYFEERVTEHSSVTETKSSAKAIYGSAGMRMGPATLYAGADGTLFGINNNKWADASNGELEPNIKVGVGDFSIKGSMKYNWQTDNVSDLTFTGEKKAFEKKFGSKMLEKIKNFDVKCGIELKNVTSITQQNNKTIIEMADKFNIIKAAIGVGVELSFTNFTTITVTTQFLPKKEFRGNNNATNSSRPANSEPDLEAQF